MWWRCVFLWVYECACWFLGMLDPWITGSFQKSDLNPGNEHFLTAQFCVSPVDVVKPIYIILKSENWDKLIQEKIPIDANDLVWTSDRSSFSNQENVLFHLSITALKEGNCLPSSVKTDNRDHCAFYFETFEVNTTVCHTCGKSN